MQLSASLFEHFDLKWCHPPYTLIPLLEEGVPLADKRRLAESFLRRPYHCCSFFLEKLRLNFPSVRSLLGEGVHVLRTWNSNLSLGIDYSERAHYALRLKLRSSGVARNATAAANTVL